MRVGTSIGDPQVIKGDQGDPGIQGVPGANGTAAIPAWVAGSYALNALVTHLETTWRANAVTVSGDIPGTSSKWSELNTVYVRKEEIMTGAPAILYKHPNGDSEYVGNNFYISNGIGLYTPVKSVPYSFNTLEFKIARIGTSGTAYLRIYESSSFIDAVPDTTYTLLKSTEVTLGTDVNTLTKVTLSEAVTVGANKFLIFLLSTKSSVQLTVKRWDNNTPGNRIPFMFCSSTSYSTIFAQTWNRTSPGTHAAVPPIVSLVYPMVTKSEYNAKIAEIEAALTDYDPRITVPENIYAAVGTQINLYYDALILAADKGLQSPVGCTVEIYCAKGAMHERSWVFTPVAGDVGSTPLTIKVFGIDGALLSDKTINLITIAASAPSAVKNVVMVGDSLTENGPITQTVREKFVSIGSNIPVFWGTMGSALNKHEGHGGWTFANFATAGSPLWNTGTGALDIANYRNSLGMGSAKFDLATLQLGINESFGAVKSDAIITNTINHAKSICTAFLADNAATKIIIMLPSICGNTKGGWATNYGASGLKEEYRANIWRLRELIITHFDNGAFNANVKVGIAGLVMDRFYGYGTTNRTVGTRYADTEVTHNNAVHPQTTGYQQLGDGIFPQILTLL